MPIKKKKTKTDNDGDDNVEHLFELPDHGAEMMQTFTSIIDCLCPDCRLKLLSYVCGYAVSQIIPEQQHAYVKDLIVSTIAASQQFASDGVGQTRH